MSFNWHSIAPVKTCSESGVRLELAGPAQRELIYAARHAVYGLELRQYPANSTERLTDQLDAFNCYIIARDQDRLRAFISVTPPGRSYSIDKYFDRARVGLRFDAGLFEIRLLTVLSQARGSLLAAAMMYAALRYVEERGGSHIVAIGRQEVLELYLRFGLRASGLRTKAGEVGYELLFASVAEVRRALEKYERVVCRIESQLQWKLPFSLRAMVSCDHGGAFWEGVGEDFRVLEKLDSVVNADVLDAWFPPAPEVIAALSAHMPSLVRTSPPTYAGGLTSAIVQHRGVPVTHVLPAAGSSELIYLAFPKWLTPKSRVLVLDPSYGEYIHVFHNVIGCRIDRLFLRRERGYEVDPRELRDCLDENYDLVVLVNPNSPTGTFIRGDELRAVLRDAPTSTRVWVDETYIEYAGGENSLERFAVNTDNVFVCKSMSKVYALSGVRAAYLIGNSNDLSKLRLFSPPWSVSLPAQVAAVAALNADSYYAARYLETSTLREALACELRARFGFLVHESCTNLLLCEVPECLPEAAEICAACQQHGVYLRDAGTISSSLGRRCLRVAVKDGRKNGRVLEVLSLVLARAASSQ